VAVLASEEIAYDEFEKVYFSFKTPSGILTAESRRRFLSVGISRQTKKLFSASSAVNVDL
jgi:hypothetical protein